MHVIRNNPLDTFTQMVRCFMYLIYGRGWDILVYIIEI